MSGTSIQQNLPLDVERKIDQYCDRFEEAWCAGTTPVLNEHLLSAPEELQSLLLRELLEIELHYRREEQGPGGSDQVVLDSHADLMPEIADALRAIREEVAQRRERPAQSEERGGGGGDESPFNQDAVATEKQSDVILVEPTPSRKDSRGLHIRCPHCHFPVELLADSPFTDVACTACGSQFSLIEREGETSQARALEQLGRFELMSRLGVGGFGTVWKARDTELDRTVAVKIPRKDQLGAAELEKFFREARAAAQLRHPNIVPVHEVGRDGDTIFIVSDYIHGRTLSDWLHETSPTARETASLMATVSDALHYAHEQRIVHRDLKPSNIMLDEALDPYVMDFGLAKREVGEITMTVDGQIMGTPAHMSPEQAAGKSHWTDRRADIYSLGVILFEMLTGELPFRGNAQMQIHQKLHADVPDPRKLNRHIPADMATICLKCLESDPNKRYATALGLADELQRFLRGEPIHARPISSLARAARWSRRHPAQAAAIALTAILAVAGPSAALTIYRQGRENINMISALSRERNKQDEEIADLEHQIDILRSRHPERVEFAAWKENLVHDFLDQRYVNVVAAMESANLAADERVRAHLGLAMLLGTVDRQEVAIRHFASAKELLSTLRGEHPNDERLATALADCCESLGASYLDRDPQRSVEEFQQAVAIREELFRPDQNELRSEMAYIDALLHAPGGGPAAAERLRKMERIRDKVQQLLATDPVAIYELCCELNIPGPRLPAAATSTNNLDK